jgi:anthranilate synthase/aminodeoxychorismate synthase-like glutamine amidotransferase
MLLLIDNYDSFTHNLARYFEELGQSVKVIRNNQINCQDIEKLSPEYLVLSPGPCTPNQAGVTLNAIRQFAGKIPILGVCLGHQAIGQVFGANLIRAEQVKHGKTSTVKHNNGKLFDNIPSEFTATRYHSLILQQDSIPECFNVTAWCSSKSSIEVMAIEHKVLNVFGVQFHPESLLTQYGHEILKNFLMVAKTLDSE